MKQALQDYAKTKLIMDDERVHDAVLAVFSGLQVIGCEQAILLGTPIGSVEQITPSLHAETVDAWLNIRKA